MTDLEKLKRSIETIMSHNETFGKPSDDSEFYKGKQFAYEVVLELIEEKITK